VEDPEKLSLMDRYTEKERFDLYEKVKNNSKHWKKKIFINLFHSSSINDQLEQVREYNCDVEITRTRYLRESDPQSGKVSEKGSVYQ
jgi:acetone carboxylase gamma subunit